MLRTLVFFLLSALAVHDVQGTDPKSRFSRAQYISMWKDVAIANMQEHGIPASITLAQAILESGDGNSRLARDANNHFGIKCHNWQGKKVYHDDDKRNECFRKYRNASESFADHSEFLKRQRYAFLFDYDVMDYKAWAHGLKKAGYATNPKYPQLLIRIIEENNLAAYDLQASTGGGAIAQKGAGKKSSTSVGSGDEIIYEVNAGAKVLLSDNRIKYILASEEETAASLARKLNMGPWQLRRYNDLDRGDRIAKGERVYLQPKRNRASRVSKHTVQPGETLRDVSQQYGVKIKRIRKKSGMDRNQEAKAGDVLILR